LVDPRNLRSDSTVIPVNVTIESGRQNQVGGITVTFWRGMCTVKMVSNRNRKFVPKSERDRLATSRLEGWPREEAAIRPDGSAETGQDFKSARSNL
jgi:hypothetical protein